ncbi:MAG: cbb3-type cytochrome c oxidase subunit I [Planctomycetota bacterium]|jgi:cytochrome c oxidase subunit 1|nr:cytochrome c oxidase subunit I [Planctomycetota bacterium]MDP6850956.1 cbb3-type cytochrome c oxidase subunit I [Planctomycetota bacterium]
MNTHASSVNYLNHETGFKSWFMTLDHKRLGLMYMWSTFAAMLLGGSFALLLRFELFSPGKDLVSKDVYNHLFTLHGAVMIFLVIIPSIPAALGNFVLPLMLGAKDVAFPKINRLSYHLYLIGAVLLVLAILTGGLDTGWTFYTPYSTSTDTSVVIAVFGAFVIGFSSIFTGLNFIATIHKMRPPGMTWFKMPLLCWALYATSVIQILATPVLGIALLLIAAERIMGVGIFDPALGGDPVLFQHLFWFYSHPAVYVMILPAMGVLSELFSTYSRKHIFGYSFIAYSSIAIAIVSFIVWGHHLYVSGQSALVSIIFSALTYTVAIPSAIKVFNWVATMYKGSISFTTGMVSAMSVIWLFGIGGLTGLWMANLSTDMHLHDTYFVVSHFHFVMVGSALFSYLGGVHHWWPKMFGVMYDEAKGRFWTIVSFLGFNLTFLPQFLMGTRGMPRRYFDYHPQYEYLNKISTIGAAMIGLAVVMIFWNLLRSLKTGKKASPNPWGAATLEWQCASPPTPHNFDEAPAVGDPYDMSLIQFKSDEEGYLPINPCEHDPLICKVESTEA